MTFDTKKAENLVAVLREVRHGRPPFLWRWRWRWLWIPLRERVWYPIKTYWYWWSL